MASYFFAIRGIFACETILSFLVVTVMELMRALSRHRDSQVKDFGSFDFVYLSCRFAYDIGK
jgi:hypothetical protein